MRALLALIAAIWLALPVAAAKPARVVMTTTEGRIVIALDPRAPITSANFLRYADTAKLDGTTFYRAARTGDGTVGLIQGGVDTDLRRTFLPIAHEPTSKTGLRHVEGTISMARNAPGTATANFFIVVGSGAHLDARPDYPGYAAFGHVVSGMAVVRRILAKPTYPGGYSATMMGQTIRDKPRILTIRRAG